MPQWPVTNVFNPPSEPGTDYGTPLGTPLYAPVAGRVTTQNTGSTGWGRSVQITPQNIGFGRALPPFGVIGAGHLNDFAVSNGEQVAAGQLLGHTGNSGDSTGPHVEIFIKNAVGQFLNPKGYPAIVEGFFSSTNQINPTGQSNTPTLPNPLSNPLDAIGSAITGAESSFVKTATNLALMAAGGLLVAVGLILLAIAVTGKNPVSRVVGAAKVATPQGRALSAVQGARRRPAPPQAAPEPAQEPEFRAGGRRLDITPEARARLRERMAS